MQTKIKSINISNFTVFAENEIEFSPGLNVLIGKNGTGKTHLLKILYTVFKVKRTLSIPHGNSNTPANANTINNLLEVFKAEALSDLIKNASSKTNSHVKVLFSNNDYVELKFGFANLQSNTDSFKDFPECLYIPPQEMLSWFNGFTALWDKREVDFDETYYQLAKALELPLLKNGSQSLSDIIKPLEEILKAKVLKENGRFYFEYTWGKVEVHLAAEGFRKLATVIYLLANGSINEKTILFWDEPEVHFNPSLTEALVALIKGLTDRGIQIFITTHDYLLSQRLSLLAEYESPDFPIKFFCLENEKNKGVFIEEGKTLAEIESNPILNEFAEYYDFERAAFKNTTKTK